MGLYGIYIDFDPAEVACFLVGIAQAHTVTYPTPVLSAWERGRIRETQSARTNGPPPKRPARYFATFQPRVTDG